MKKQQPLRGLESPLSDILPPEFDVEDVSSFFSPRGSQRDMMSPSNRNAPEARGAERGKEGRFDKAVPALDAANEKTPVDLANRATPLNQSDADIIETVSENGAGAKPSWAGGSTDNEGGKKGKGKGKDKDNTGEETPPPPEEETPPPPEEETGETNPGSTDPNIYVSGMDNPNGFNVEIVYVGEWGAPMREHLENVAEFVSDIIIGDLPSHNGIDDISITATLREIDGAGGYFGWGGTGAERADSRLPSTGYMQFDSADVAKVESLGLWEDLMLHEMMHSLGFGVSWNEMGLVENINGDLRFTGENATRAYNTEFASTANNDALSDIGVPVETDGGSGTAGVHWDDATFTKEMLSSNLRPSGNYLSDMSIGALEDMGYETIFDDVFAVA